MEPKRVTETPKIAAEIARTAAEITKNVTETTESPFTPSFSSFSDEGPISTDVDLPIEDRTTVSLPSEPPTECQTAINFTEGWRRDVNGSYIKPNNGSPNCDSINLNRAGNPWFRFSKDAGTHLLTYCPPFGKNQSA